METSSDIRHISAGLARIRLLRRLFLAILFIFLPVVALTMAYIERGGSWLTLAVPFGLFAGGIAVQKVLYRQSCPHCTDFFFVLASSRTAYTPSPRINFPPSTRCRHCGLALYP